MLAVVASVHRSSSASCSSQIHIGSAGARPSAAYGRTRRPGRASEIGSGERDSARRHDKRLDGPLRRRVPRLAGICAEENWQRQIYLQLNLTGEDAKHGMQVAECEEALALAGESDHLQVLGLMGMAPLAPTDQCNADSVFKSMGHLARQFESENASKFAAGHCGLSMGMSSDLESAVSAGSTCLRIGSDLYVESEEGQL